MSTCTRGRIREGRYARRWWCSKCVSGRCGVCDPCRAPRPQFADHVSRISRLRTWGRAVQILHLASVRGQATRRVRRCLFQLTLIKEDPMNLARLAIAFGGALWLAAGGGGNGGGTRPPSPPTKLVPTARAPPSRDLNNPPPTPPGASAPQSAKRGR